MTTPDAPNIAKVWLEAGDAVELGELLAFLGQWLDDAPDQAERWLARCSCYGYTLQELRVDLDRFAFLLGHLDAEVATRLLDGPPTDPSRSSNP
jgi:hypothetical protein